MKMPEVLQQETPKILLMLLVGTLAYFGSQLIHALSDPFWQHIAPAIPVQALLSLSSLLLVLVVFLLAYLFYLQRPDRIMKKYRFDPPSGISYHKDTAEQFCTKCLHKMAEVRLGKLEAPPNGWVCMVCSTGYTEKSKVE